MRIRRLAALALGSLLGGVAWEAPAGACSICGCGDPLLSASDAVPVVGQLRLDLTAEYLTASARSDDDAAVTERLAQTTLKLVAGYSPVARLNLVVSIPAVLKQWNASGGSSNSQSASPYGLGDIEAGARLFLLDSIDVHQLSRQSVALTVGTSFPTGPDDATVDGARLDQHAQLGTGSFGPYVGLQYRFARDPFNVFASLTGRMHSTNDYQYRFGNALMFSVQFQYHPIDRLAIHLGVDGRWAARDTSLGAPQENTGGFALAASPGLQFNVVADLWLTAQVQLPFYTHLYGEQSLGPIVSGGLQYRLF